MDIYHLNDNLGGRINGPVTGPAAAAPATEAVTGRVAPVTNEERLAAARGFLDTLAELKARRRAYESGRVDPVYLRELDALIGTCNEFVKARLKRWAENELRKKRPTGGR